MPTGSGSGGRLRKATPRAIASSTGKRKTQKIASGSRRNSRNRASVSWTSGEESGPRARQVFMRRPRAVRRAARRADRGAVGERAALEGAPGEGDEEVLERRVVGGQPARLDPARGEPGEERRHRPVDLAHGEPDRQRRRAGPPRRSGQVGEDRRRDLAVGLELDDVLGAERGDERRRGAQGEDPAAVDDRDPVAEPRRLFHVVGGEQDRPPALLEPLDDLPDLAARGRVEPGGRLVEEQHLGVADQRAGERQALLLAAGELAHERPPLLLEADEGERRRRFETVAVEAAEELDELGTRSFSGKRVSWSCTPSRARSAWPSPCQRSPSTSSVPPSGESRPSKSSTVVVLPAPFGPSRPKHSPAWRPRGRDRRPPRARRSA